MKLEKNDVKRQFGQMEEFYEEENFENLGYLQKNVDPLSKLL